MFWTECDVPKWDSQQISWVDPSFELMPAQSSLPEETQAPRDVRDFIKAGNSKAFLVLKLCSSVLRN